MWLLLIKEHKMFYSTLLNKATFINTTDSQDVVQQTNQSDEAQDEEDHVPPSKKKKPLNLFKFMEKQTPRLIAVQLKLR